MLDMAGPEPEAPASEGTPPAQLGLSWFPQGGAFANFAPPPACTSPPLCTESSTCAPSPRRRLPARSSPCTESSTCALSLRRRLPARSTPSPTSSIHTICPSAWRHDRSLRHFSIITPAKSGLDVFGHGSLVPAARAVNITAPCSTQLQGAQRALGGIALGDDGDCGRLPGAAEWRFGEASTLDGWCPCKAGRSRTPRRLRFATRRAGRLRTTWRLRPAVGHRRL